MHDPDPALIRSTLREIVESQIRDGDPPETKETFERLIAEGIPESEVWRLLSFVVLTELNEVIKEDRVFNREAFVNALKKLPRLKFD